MTDLAQRMAALNLLAVPVWATDPEGPRIVWANDAAVQLFSARDAAELYSRDFSDVSPAVRARVQHALDENRAGRCVSQQATLYPRGRPVTVKITITRVDLDDGRQGLLQHATVKDEVDSDLLRSIEALRHIPAIVCLLDGRGELLMRNPAAIRAFGDREALAEWFVDPADAAAVVAVVGREALERVVRVRTLAGERWFSLVAHPRVDPVTGQQGVLLHMADETARREAEQTAAVQTRLAAELAEALGVVEAQHRQILTLSAPVLDIGDGVLAVPIIGRLDAERSQELSPRLLALVAAKGARDVLLDLTGVDAPDASCARYLVELSRAVELLGARALLTGLSPALARALVESGAAVTGLGCLRDLRQGLERCRERRSRASLPVRSP